MSRSLAIILTIIATLVCGLPGLGLLCLGSLAAIGGVNPATTVGYSGSAQDLWLGVTLFICAGLSFVLIPFAVGFLAFRLSKHRESPAQSDLIVPLPPPD